jgi:hypothetical protein
VYSKFFPSTEPEAESDWENVEAGESAENGPAITEEVTAKEEVKEENEAGKAEKVNEIAEEKNTEEKVDEETTIQLPDVPTSEPKIKPAEGEPTTKKQKSDDDEEL